VLRYFFNYSSEEKILKYNYEKGKELLSRKRISRNTELQLEPWGMKIVEEE
jgi:beta-galactosidase